MECNQTAWLTDQAYLKWLDDKVERERVPLSGTIDLTHQCNLRCVHCYLGDKTPRKMHSTKELSTDQWLRIIDEFTEAGCLFLLISGGEPLLRKDFKEIYGRLKTNGLLVTVFTNGTTITDDILDLFDDLPPHLVEITLYGATEKTYERITGSGLAFRRCINGIEALVKNKIHVSLKTILMTLNSPEFFAVKEIAKDYGVEFRFDAAIFPCFDGDKSPLDLRVSPKEAVEKEFFDERVSREWKDYYEKRKDLRFPDYLYLCGAGVNNFYIDPYGHLQPCVLVTDPQYNILNGEFLKGWRNVIPGVQEKKAGKDYACNRCDKMVLCGVCPGFFRLENGSEEICSEYLCHMGQERLNALNASA
jgi:radical SAM protein with 4Fe4S-binding SPASM domain